MWLTLFSPGYIQELYEHLPAQRKLPEETKKQAEHLLKLKANRKLIQQELSKQSNKIILFKDLSNIHQRMKERESRNDVDFLVNTLQKKYGQ